METEFKNSNMMHWYLKMCCRYDLIKLLKSFSNGIGYGICETMLVFGDDPDENDPSQEREYPELEGYCGVGFFNEHYPEPVLVSYQTFYDELQKIVLDYSKNKDSEYQNTVKHYLSLIRERYNLIEKGEST